MHDFFGNKTTNPIPPWRVCRRGITCTRTADKSAYWIPTAKWIDKSGTRTLTVDKGLFYYRLASKDPNVDV